MNTFAELELHASIDDTLEVNVDTVTEAMVQALIVVKGMLHNQFPNVTFTIYE